MATPAYLGEFEQLLLLAVLRLGAEAYGGRHRARARGARRAHGSRAARSTRRSTGSRTRDWCAGRTAAGHPRATGCRAVSTPSRPPEWPRCVRRADVASSACGDGFDAPASKEPTSMTAGRPPRLAEWLLRRMLPPGVRERLDPRRPRRRLRATPARPPRASLAYCAPCALASRRATALRRETP